MRTLPTFLVASLLASATQAVAQNPLATSDQAALDRQALRVFANQQVQDQIASVMAAFSADPYAAKQEGKDTLRAAAQEVVFAAVQDSINRDPARPRLQWVWAPSHSWFGAAIPASKVLMPNVDNVFRIIPVDSFSHYRIAAKPAGSAPTQFSIQLLPALPGEAKWSKVIQEVVDTDIEKSADGSFSLSIGPEPGAAANHIATTPAARFLLIRDTIQDWHKETPYRLSVTRLDGPPAAREPSDTELASQAAARVQEIVPRIRQVKFGGFATSPGFFAGPSNQLTAPQTREGGRWGLSASGHFRIAGDEALSITLDPGGAAYLSVQLASGWLSSLDYVHRTATLNLAQSRRNADGTLTFVIAARDPGVANWLDTAGLHEGSMFVRWQGLPAQPPANPAGVRDTRLVKISGITRLPHVAPGERRAGAAQRAADYGRRSAQP